MASSSSSALVLASNYRYKVFCSFHGPDVRKTLLSHIRTQFENKAITMFNDQGIERGAEIAPSLIDAIRGSRISIVILTKKYASSSWCLDELIEILECKETMGQIVMTIFYGVDPSHVRKQSGEFGKAFDETCARKTDEEKQKWSKALYEVSNIAGEDFLRWDNEAKMIEKIAKDVLNKLNATPSRDFDNMVGLDAHLREIQSLLDLDNDGVKIVGVSGPAGIGKTTIARALYAQLANKFQLSCFVNNLRESSHSGFDEHGLKLSLQEQLLSEILNQSGLRISHLGAIKENLRDQRVLIILDDVNNRKQLEALANETTWFGSGSRILITTENNEILQQHDDITNIYNVEFPSDEDALKILCKYAFRQTSPWHGFEKLAESVIEGCGKLPLGLSVVGSTLRGKKEDEWEDVIRRLNTTIDREIEDVLSVGYESLDQNEQKLFLHIAIFFNNTYGRSSDYLKTMFTNCSDLDVTYGLKILERRSLIEIYKDVVVMHELLQQMGRKAIQKQEPWKRHILIDPDEICAVLEGAKDAGVVSGISFDISNIDEVEISKKAFKKLCNLRFLKIYNSKDDGTNRMYTPEKMELPRRLRLLHWEAYPCKSLRSITIPKYLVELKMRNSQLEKLWEGTQPLENLKEMDLSFSKNLKELPDLSNATNLKEFFMIDCESLVEIPSSFSHLHKLQKLYMDGCINIQNIPADMNLASLEGVFMEGCSRLRNIPKLMSTNIEYMHISGTAVDCKGLIYLPSSVKVLDLADNVMEEIPDCIKDLHQLYKLNLRGCSKLKSLPELPPSLRLLIADNCESLKTIFLPLNAPLGEFKFINCFKLSQKTRRKMIQNPSIYERVIFPGTTVPAEFDQRAKGKTLTVVIDGNKSYYDLLFCVLISPNLKSTSYGKGPELWCRLIGQGDFPYTRISSHSPISSEHLIIFRYHNFGEIYVSEVSREVTFEFGIVDWHDIIECGAKIWNQEKSIEESYESESEQESYETESGSKEGSNWHLTYKTVGILSTVAIFLFFCLLCSIFLKFK